MVLVGVLLHELGHAFAGRRLGLEPWIQLHAFGGLTGWRRPRPLTPVHDIMISASGPAVGIAVGGALLAAGLAGVVEGETMRRILEYAIWVNLGWGVLNLLPVLPLDGGHIAASLARLAFGERGQVVALALSIALTVVLAGWAVVAGQWWLAILGVVLTLANVRSLKSAWEARRWAGRAAAPPPGGDS
jgi:membrane-associated protease RseP (regulator of RpoE activity)